MNGSGEIISETGQSVNVASAKTLSQKVELAFKDAVASKLNGKIPERTCLKLNTREDGYHPILKFLIQDDYSSTKTTVEIPVGLANQDERNYFAGINGEGYRLYKSPEDVGYEAAQVFRHNYIADVMGI
ncbi:MAG: hypothetical protein CMI58_00630 [Parcubacteria group bacterium]|jgi:hypothetical protein|nr:hypothetical protein [Parcubacteria group bacterium]|tara:strand:+ start:382 stop:768 length:387 start_codon:yes stop_codon:yes gene_type:complete